MLNKKLKELRESKSLSQLEIGNILGISNTSWSNYEKGHRAPDYVTLIKIAKFFGVTTDYLLDVEGDIRESELKIRPGNHNYQTLDDLVLALYNKLIEEEIIKDGEPLPDAAIKILMHNLKKNQPAKSSAGGNSNK